MEIVKEFSFFLGKPCAIIRLHSLCSWNREVLRDKTELLPNLIKMTTLLATNFNNESTKNVGVKKNNDLFT